VTKQEQKTVTVFILVKKNIVCAKIVEAPGIFH
jgi:hypothetical protein